MTTDHNPPLIHKIGTIDCDLVETTPVVFRDRTGYGPAANLEVEATGDGRGKSQTQVLR